MRRISLTRTVGVISRDRISLPRSKDVGKAKAIVAAEFIMERVPGVTVTPYVLLDRISSTGWPPSLTVCHVCSYHGKIQDRDDDYYMQFNIVICGLDSVDARRWMSATLVNLVDPAVPESLKPMIDGGTEGESYWV